MTDTNPASRRWWQRRCTGRLRGPLAVLHMEWRCDLRRKHAGRCHFEPDDWPELVAVGGWRGLRDGTWRRAV